MAAPSGAAARPSLVRRRHAPVTPPQPVTPHDAHAAAAAREILLARMIPQLQAAERHKSKPCRSRETAFVARAAQAKVQALEGQVHALTARLKELEMERAHNTAQLDLLAKCAAGAKDACSRSCLRSGTPGKSAHP